VGLVLLLVGGGAIAALLLLGGVETTTQQGGQSSPAASPTAPVEPAEPTNTLVITTFANGTGGFQTASDSDFQAVVVDGTYRLTGNTAGWYYDSFVDIPVQESVTITATVVPAGKLSAGSGPGLVALNADDTEYLFFTSTKWGAELAKKTADPNEPIKELAARDLDTPYPGKGTLVLVAQLTVDGTRLSGYLDGKQVVTVFDPNGTSQISGVGLAVNADVTQTTVAFDDFLAQGGIQTPKA